MGAKIFFALVAKNWVSVILNAVFCSILLVITGPCGLPKKVTVNSKSIGPRGVTGGLTSFFAHIFSAFPPLG